MHSHSQIHSTPRNLWLGQTECIQKSMSRLWFIREAYKLEPINRLGIFVIDFKGVFRNRWSEKIIFYAFKDYKLCGVPVRGGGGRGQRRELESPWSQNNRVHPIGLSLVIGLFRGKCYEKLPSGRTYLILLSSNDSNDIKLHTISIATKWKDKSPSCSPISLKESPPSTLLYSRC